MQDNGDKVRIDKWLWAARFYKTRALAAGAVEGGKVRLDGARVKPSKTLRPGDALEIRQGPYRYSIMVRELSDRRGSAALASQLYAENEESKKAREQLKAQLQMQSRPFHKGRPTKRARRQLQKFTDYYR
ncbi:MAG TPA: S4 domain-containing protein [Burkholderiales bacterium]|nr:S4 domain-containing protein [Burkholderiales bacterium]